MAQNRLCIKRGVSSEIVSLFPGEPAYSTDARHLYIGNTTGPISSYLNSDQVDAQLTTTKKELVTQIDAYKMQLEELVRCNGVIDNIALSQKAPNLIDKINGASPLISSELTTSHNGLNLEQTYTHFLKSLSYDFPSVNGKINIHKAVENSKIISLKVTGQTTNLKPLTLILVNNDTTYSFYASVADKKNNTPIELFSGDSFELLEDGTGILIKNGVTSTIPKELVPVILLEAENIIYFNSGTLPSEFNIIAPINQNAHIEEMLGLLEQRAASIATLSTEV